MQIVPLYRDVLRALSCRADPTPAWPHFEAIAYRPHQPYFDGLLDTYGPDFFGPDGLPATVNRMAPMLKGALQSAADHQMEQRAAQILGRVAQDLPTPVAAVYLGTLFFTAPAATISVTGQPTIVLGLERFAATAQSHSPKYWYRPDEVEEMLPHEAAHASRMQVLGLPPTPQRLSLLDMVMLEGTALTFTDQLLGRMTLATFMPAETLAWHRANDAHVVGRAAREFDAIGLDLFGRYFAPNSPVSGYYVGWRLCRDFLDRYGEQSMSALLTMPSREILTRLGP